MSTKLRIPRYFQSAVRSQIGELYASTAIADLAIAVVMLFEPIFLYSVLKFTIPQILWFMAAVYACYLVLLPLGAKIASRYGYFHSIAFSIPFQVVYWLLLFGSQERQVLIYFAPLAFALEKSLFWPAFHASVSRFARDEQRGREFSVLYAIVNMTYVVGPFIGGFVSEKFGVRVTFILASVVYFCSFLPLFTQREIFVAKVYQFRDTLSLFRQYPKKFFGYLGFGEELIGLTIWPLFIYLVVKDYQKAGLLTTIATLASLLMALYIGKITDSYSKKVLIVVGGFLNAMIWAARFVVTSFWSAFALDALSRTSKDMVFIPVSTVTYQRAEESHIMPYVVFFEQSLSVGKLLACIIGVIIFTLTGSFYSLFILAALFSLFYMLV